MQPWGPVWDVTEEHPIGDGVQIPEGASNIPRNFLRQLNIGREMAKAVLSITESGPSDLLALPDVPMEFKESREYSRLSNWLFRAGLSPRSVLPRNINLELTQVECLLENDCLTDIDLESPVEDRTGLGASSFPTSLRIHHTHTPVISHQPLWPALLPQVELILNLLAQVSEHVSKITSACRWTLTATLTSVHNAPVR
jgi:hypothetical protein